MCTLAVDLEIGMIIILIIIITKFTISFLFFSFSSFFL